MCNFRSEFVCVSYCCDTIDSVLYETASSRLLRNPTGTSSVKPGVNNSYMYTYIYIHIHTYKICTMYVYMYYVCIAHIHATQGAVGWVSLVTTN